MPRTCSVCLHEERDAIDKTLVSGEAATTVTALYFTKRAPLAHGGAEPRGGTPPDLLAKAHAAAEVAHAEDLLGQVRSLHGKALTIPSERGGRRRPAPRSWRSDRHAPPLCCSASSWASSPIRPR